MNDVLGYAVLLVKIILGAGAVTLVAYLFSRVVTLGVMRSIDQYKTRIILYRKGK